MTYLPPRCPCGELLYEVWEEDNHVYTFDEEAGCYTEGDWAPIPICPCCRKEVWLDEFDAGVGEYLADEWGEQPILGTSQEETMDNLKKLLEHQARLQEIYAKAFARYGGINIWERTSEQKP